MDKNLHLGIACGGTGGHFFPALSIARELRRQGGQATMIIAGHHAADQIAMTQREGFAAVQAEALRIPQHRLDMPLFPFRLLAAAWRSRALLKRVQPDAVLGMGSFASVPVGLAAAFLRVPLVLHEGNVVTGRANRLLSRWARVLATSFPEQADLARVKCPTRHVGFPLREELVHAARNPFAPNAYLTALGLDPALPVLLVFGGSQGARFLNDTVPQALRLLDAEARKRFQLLHFTGQEENRALLGHYRQTGLPFHIKQSESEMHQAYLAAGLVICRAGGATISELALFVKPAILVPLPSAAEDHQTANARMVSRLGGGIASPQAETTPETIAALIRDWLSAPERFARLGSALAGLAVPDASANVVRLVRELRG